MKANPTESSGSKLAFQKLLATGLGVWFLTQIALVAVGFTGEPRRSWISAVDWAVGLGWIGCLAGLVALLAMAVRHPGGMRRALIAYLVPCGLYAVFSAVFYAIYPDQSFLYELSGFLPLVWLFGVLGWFWLRLRPEEPGGDTLACALLPPLIGGMAVLIGVAVPTFRSNPFVYRDAFDIDLKKSAFADGKLAADAVLEIRKPGDYRFRAVKYSHADMMDMQDSGADNMIGRIEWTSGGAPPAAATGTYPLTIRWDKSSAPSPASDDAMGDDCIVIEVSTSADPNTVVRTLSVPLRAN